MADVAGDRAKVDYIYPFPALLGLPTPALQGTHAGSSKHGRGIGGVMEEIMDGKTIIKQLQRLHQAAPDMCQRDGALFIIGEYQFFEHQDYPLIARIGTVGASCKGQPALDWLQGALRRAIEARGWTLDTRLSPGPALDVNYISVNYIVYAFVNTQCKAEAMLAALLAAVEGEK